MLMVMLATLLSRSLGFIREVAVAYRFGASLEADAYLVAVLLPTILFYSFSDALKSTFITVFASFKGERDAPLFLNTLTLSVAVVLVALVLLGLLFAPQLVFVLAPGFKGEVFELTVRLTRILLPGIFFMGLAGVAIGFLHSHSKFLIPALINVPHNIIVILSAIYLGLAYGVEGLAWGTLLAIASQLLLQLPSLRRTSFTFRPGISFQHPGLQRAFALLPAILFSSAVLELKHLLDRLFASFLQPGSIAALNYAERIYMLPQALFVSAFIAVFYPTLVELLSRRREEDFVTQVKWGVSVFLFILMPTTVGLIVLRHPLVEFLFQRGAFDAAATELTSYALLFYAPALLGFSLHCFCNRIFFALQEIKTLVMVNIAMVSLNALLNYLLMPLLGHGGVALGTSLAFIAGSLWLFVIIAYRFRLSLREVLLKPLFRSALMSAIMWIVLALAIYGWSVVLGRPFSGILVLIGAGVLGGAVYAASAFYFRAPELGMLQKIVRGLFASRNAGKKEDS